MNSNRPVFLLILAIIVALIAIIFSLQNAQVITLKLFGLEFKATLALALLIFFGLGAILAVLLLSPRLLNSSSKISKLTKQKEVAENKLLEYQNALEGVQNKYEQLRSRAMQLLPEGEKELYQEEAKEQKKKGFLGLFGG